MTYPSTIYLIRHAEKPQDDNPHLSREGYNRAWNLIKVFGRFSGRFEAPQALIAADKSKHSNRCVETLQPLAKALGLDIDHHFDDDEFKDLAKRLKKKEKYGGSTILICWHHGNIPNLAKALGVNPKDLTWKSWPDDDFASIWILRFDEGGLRSVESEKQ